MYSCSTPRSAGLTSLILRDQLSASFLQEKIEFYM